MIIKAAVYLIGGVLFIGFLWFTLQVLVAGLKSFFDISFCVNDDETETNTKTNNQKGKDNENK